MLWVFFGLAVFVSASLHYRAARLECQQARGKLLTDAEAYMNAYEATGAAD